MRNEWCSRSTASSEARPSLAAISCSCGSVSTKVTGALSSPCAKLRSLGCSDVSLLHASRVSQSSWSCHSLMSRPVRTACSSHGSANRLGFFFCHRVMPILSATCFPHCCFTRGCSLCRFEACRAAAGAAGRSCCSQHLLKGGATHFHPLPA